MDFLIKVSIVCFYKKKRKIFVRMQKVRIFAARFGNNDMFYHHF
jgi:hypothetical protein